MPVLFGTTAVVAAGKDPVSHRHSLVEPSEQIHEPQVIEDAGGHGETLLWPAESSTALGAKFALEVGTSNHPCKLSGTAHELAVVCTGGAALAVYAGRGKGER